MRQGYFHRVTRESPTRFWVNNPTREEADMAIEAGALGCTCNPSYCQKMIDHPTEGPYALAMLDRATRQSKTDSEAETILQRLLVKPVMDKFLSVYEGTKGRHGFVSIQGDPIEEHDPQVIIEEAIRNRQLGQNACIKVPVTVSGLLAMEELIAEDVPMNSTEIMSVAQAISLCETYERVSKKCRKSPMMYLSHIAGIYDDYLKRYAERESVNISSDVLWQAGLAVARKVYRIIVERKYPVTFIGGGARGLHHFTEMVGGDVVVTINWKGTADQLLEQDPPVVYRLFNPVPEHVIHELLAKLPDFTRAYLEDGLAVEEYAEFGPVAFFRDSFINSWRRVLGLAKERRLAMEKAVGQ
jgi:transaldolase